MDSWAAALALMKVSAQRDVSPSRAHTMAAGNGAPAAAEPAEQSLHELLFGSSTSSGSSGAGKSAPEPPAATVEHILNLSFPHGKRAQPIRAIVDLPSSKNNFCKSLSATYGTAF